MTLVISKGLTLHQPQYPTSPAPSNGDTWTDPVTNMTWTYQSSTSTWVNPVELPPPITVSDYYSSWSEQNYIWYPEAYPDWWAT
jgi:hypothetical protein